MIDYNSIIQLIQNEVDKIEEALKSNQSKKLLNEIHKYKQSIKWLKVGQNYNIDPRSKLITLPEPSVKTPSSEFRLVEDLETDNQDLWREVKIDGEEFRPMQGDIVIKLR